MRIRFAHSFLSYWAYPKPLFASRKDYFFILCFAKGCSFATLIRSFRIGLTQSPCSLRERITSLSIASRKDAHSLRSLVPFVLGLPKAPVRFAKGLLLYSLLRERMRIRFAHSFLSYWAYPKPLFASRTGFFHSSTYKSKLLTCRNKKTPHFVRGFVTALGFKPKTF